jgi:indolepyruvate ferredoxin oxidoreductase
VRANGLDRIVWDSPNAKLGIITTGKSFGDTMQALSDSASTSASRATSACASTRWR